MEKEATFCTHKGYNTVVPCDDSCPSPQKKSECEEKDTSWEEKIVENLIEEISKNHAKILDDFTKAYISSRWGDYFSKQKKIDFRRIELCHQVKSPTENVYWFRMKRGKLPSNLTK